MQGLMMDYPLSVQHIFTRATRLFPHKEIVTKTADGLHRYTYREFGERTARLASTLRSLGIQPGDRVGTFGWNTYRHMELYFAVPCMGAVLHTLNIRLFTDQLEFVVNDAEDKIIVVDADLLPLLEKLAGRMPTVRAFIVMGKPAEPSRLTPAYDYEALLASSPAHYEWPRLDENDAAAMCYTSGTTGNPKGVVYSHRSTFLHSFGACLADSLGVCERDTVMPVVPMFHANAWGLIYAGAMAGANMVLPGKFMTPASLVDLIVGERVTVPAGVPSIWIGLLSHLEQLRREGQAPDFSFVRCTPCGGSAIPPALMRGLDSFGMTMLHAWGMTETSPLASVAKVNSAVATLTPDEQFAMRCKQGQVVPGVEVRVLDLATNQEVPWDGKGVGEIQVRGPWIAAAYYHTRDTGEKFMDGWLRTGDVATIDEYGYMQIVDRTKDLVKSGGEWISSVELENVIMAHPKVLEAAVIGAPHPKWQERPVAYVVPKQEFVDQITAEEVLEYLESRVAKWWLPDEVIFIKEVPKTSVGKFSKRELRDQYAATHTGVMV
ncbi:MAG TPA: long-chain fatty acid--CoA ligase [Ktedonobacterales bacterium]|nr:long-chain fatty acid--CoA ligase [Ktedonobacterales bacterium]